MNDFELLSSKEYVLGIIKAVLQITYTSQKYIDLVDDLITTSVKLQLDLIESSAESQIEKTFGYAVMIAFVMKGYVFFPGSIVKDLLNRTETDEEAAIASRLMDKLVKVDIPMVMLFPQLKLKTKQRLDFSVWLLRNNKCNVLGIELDGYEYHKKRFTEDRRKDRQAKEQGIDVYRFSGSEIYNHIFDCVKEILDWIDKEVRHE